MREIQIPSCCSGYHKVCEARSTSVFAWCSSFCDSYGETSFFVQLPRSFPSFLLSFSLSVKYVHFFPDKRNTYFPFLLIVQELFSPCPSFQHGSSRDAGAEKKRSIANGPGLFTKRPTGWLAHLEVFGSAGLRVLGPTTVCVLQKQAQPVHSRARRSGVASFVHSSSVTRR